MNMCSSLHTSNARSRSMLNPEPPLSHRSTANGTSPIIENTRHRQRELDLRIAYGSQFLLLRLRERLHFGGSVLCLLGTRMITCGRKEPPPSQTNRSTNYGTS